MANVTKADVVREVVKLAGEDQQFRAQLLSNPKEALKAKTGFEFPPEADVKVLQESPNSTYIVLPAAQGQELGDEALAQVAGGQAQLQLQQFARGSFMTRFPTESFDRAGTKLPGGQAALNLQWG